MKKRLNFLIIGLVLFLPLQVFADIQLKKKEVRLTVKPGENIRGALLVRNHSNESFRVKVYSEDFIYISPFDGRKQVEPSGSTLRSCAEWIKVSPDIFDMTSKEEKEIAYSIDIPADVQGGYYGVLFFEKLPKEIQMNIGVVVAIRMGCSFFLETADKEKKINLEKISISLDNIEGNFINSGNVILIGQGSFYIMGKDGIVVERGEMRKFYLPPEQGLPFTIKMEELPIGNYTTVITFNVGEEDILMKEIEFVKENSGDIKILEVRE